MSLIDIAQEIGRGDCEDGLARTPAESGALLGMHLQHGIALGDMPELLAAWLDGWDSAEPVEYTDYDCGPSWRECWHGWPKGECPSCHQDSSGRGGGREEVGY